MIPEEISRLAQAINALRPDWPTPSLRTFITTNFSQRPYPEIAKAFTIIATDPETRVPTRILNNGPWWNTNQPNNTSSNGFGNYGPRCRCGKTRTQHNEAESKVPDWARHPFETEDEHQTKLHRERRNAA